MREYGQVQCAFWQSQDFQSIDDPARLLFLYLITGPHSNGLGVFRLPFGYITADTGWDADKIQYALDGLERVSMVFREGQYVCIRGFLRWNRIINPNSAAARMKEFRSLPDGFCRQFAAREMLANYNFKPLEESFLRPFANGSATVPEGVMNGSRRTSGTNIGRPSKTIPEDAAENKNSKDVKTRALAAGTGVIQ